MTSSGVAGSSSSTSSAFSARFSPRHPRSSVSSLSSHPVGSPSGAHTPDEDKDNKGGLMMRTMSTPSLQLLVSPHKYYPPPSVPYVDEEEIERESVSRSSKQWLLHLAQVVPPNVYVQQRVGTILSRSMILKADSFIASLPPSNALDLHLLGAPNMQQIRPFLIFGVGQPTMSGIRAMMNLIKAKRPSHRHVTWICLREEPVVYLNNRPFVLRELSYPFHNMVDFAGIDADRLNHIESALKEDILNEASSNANNGNILVHDEIIAGECRACWESVDHSTVRTSLEVFNMMKQEGYSVDYVRIPITAESVFDAKQVDAIMMALLSNVEEGQNNSHLMMHTTMSSPSMTSTSTSTQADVAVHIHTFNCQLGKGRSTAGVIIAYLLECHLLNQPPKHFVSASNAVTAGGAAAVHPLSGDSSSISNPVPITSPSSSSSPSSPSDDTDHQLAAYRRGNWDVILKLVRMLLDGSSAKADVDCAIDACGRVHHLRNAIVTAFINSEHARGDTQYRSLNAATAAAMKKYFYLICFQSWLRSTPTQLTVEYMQTHSFSHFLRSHPELTKLADTMIQADRLMEVFAAPLPSLSTDECPTIDARVFSRGGSVLSTSTILKSEFFVPNKQNGKKQRLSVSTHYRQLGPLPLSATAQPNIPGIKRILKDLYEERSRHTISETDTDDEAVAINRLPTAAAMAVLSTSPARSSISSTITGSAAALLPVDLRVIWINLREEPVVFIEDDPYLLRDYFHPFRVLSEFTTGMTEERCDQIENRLREDIIRETHQSESSAHSSSPSVVHSPHILVHDEITEQQLKPRYVSVPSPSVVRTTKQVYEELQRDGVNLSYHRVPLHTEEVPSINSFDRLFTLLNAQPLMQTEAPSRSLGGGVSIVFNDQKGGRRATMGLVLACLTLIHQGSLDLQENSENEQHHDTQHTDQHSDTDVALPVPASPASLSSSAVDARGQSPHADNVPPLKRTTSTLIVDREARAAARLQTGRAEYKGILSLIRILKRGRYIKEEVDTVIDLCGSQLNIRDSIVEVLKLHDLDRTGDTHKIKLEEAAEHCQSYALLLIFNAYLHERKEKWEEQQQMTTETHTAQTTHIERHPNNTRHLKQQVSMSDDDLFAMTSPAGASATDSPLSPEQIDSGQLVNYDVFNPYIAGEKQTEEMGNGQPNQTETETKKEGVSSTASIGSPVAADARASFSFPSFSVWFSARPELRLALEFIRNESEEALKLNQTMINEEFAHAFEQRDGNVLVRGSLLKNDHFSGVLNQNVVQLIDGAINFRPIEHFSVAGTGIPTADGIQRILQFYTAEHQATHSTTDAPLHAPFRASSLLWLNLREEPILYVNHRPFVLRDGDNPYSNLENTGITPRRVEAMEKQLKQDAWQEVLSLGQEKLLLHDEDENGNLFAYYEIVISLDALKTPKEEFYAVFSLVQQSWARAQPSFIFSAQYYRTPITDEQAPSPPSVDAMVKYFEAGRNDRNRALICNCQMGRGRTTTGIIIACLWLLHRGNKQQQHKWEETHIKSKKDKQKEKEKEKAGNTTTDAVTPSAAGPSPPPVAAADATGVSPAFASSLRAGWYKVISSLVRLLPHGRSIKQQVDRVIDHCAAMQNLREVVYETQVTALTCLPRKKSFFVRRGSNYLIRYFFLIAINAYLRQEKQNNYQLTFVKWLNQRQEILNAVKRVEFPELERTQTAAAQQQQ